MGLTFDHNHIDLNRADLRLRQTLALLQQIWNFLWFHCSIRLCPIWHHLPDSYTYTRGKMPINGALNTHQTCFLNVSLEHTHIYTHHSSTHHSDAYICGIKYSQGPSTWLVSGSPSFHRNISWCLDKTGQQCHSRQFAPQSHSWEGCSGQLGSYGRSSALRDNTFPETEKKQMKNSPL